LILLAHLASLLDLRIPNSFKHLRFFKKPKSGFSEKLKSTIEKKKKNIVKQDVPHHSAYSVVNLKDLYISAALARCFKSAFICAL